MIPSIGAAATDILARAAWRPVRDLGSGLDLLRSTGLSYMLQRRREQRAWARVPTEARNSAYHLIWGEAAAELEADMRALGDGYFEFRRGEAFTRFQRADTPVDSAEVLELAFDKAQDYRRMRKAGVPVPEHLEFNLRDPSLAIAFLEDAGGPCVVKPAAGTGAGSGVTSGVRTRGHLARAALRASRNAERLLIEREAHGDDYRALVLDGEILDVVRRKRPCVIGDGRSTVGQLIAAENRRRLAGDGLERLRMLAVDLDAVLALERHGLKVRSRVPTGDRIAVKRVVNQNAARENETIHEPPSSELQALLLRAARATGLRLSGIDLVANDLADPLKTGAVILEVNGNPGIHHHYAVADRRRATRVALPILRTLLREPAGAQQRKITRNESL